MAINWTIMIGLFVFAGFWRTSLSVRLEFIPQDGLSLSVNECQNVTLSQNEDMSQKIFVRIFSTFPDIASPSPTSLQEYSNWSTPIEICGIEAGSATIIALVPDTETLYNNVAVAYLSVLVYKGSLLQALSDFSGWAYFVAWSLCFYPQIYQNYVRKSVVGLDFDYVALSLTGFCLYLVYNSGMYFSTEIQREYFLSDPKGVIPVMLNDEVYSFYIFVGYFYVVYQCCRYEHGTQRVSNTARCLLLLIAVIVVISVALAYMSTLQWLDVLQYCSYIELTIVTVKYIPQAIWNYRRKSTVGWSVVQVQLSLIGGVFSLMQMIINCYNYNDWDSILGNLTKFGIALDNVVFNVFFVYQHYVLYRDSYDEITTPLASIPWDADNVRA